MRMEKAREDIDELFKIHAQKRNEKEKEKIAQALRNGQSKSPTKKDEPTRRTFDFATSLLLSF